MLTAILFAIIVEVIPDACFDDTGGPLTCVLIGNRLRSPVCEKYRCLPGSAVGITVLIFVDASFIGDRESMSRIFEIEGQVYALIGGKAG